MARGQAKREWRKPGRRQGYRVLAPERHLIVCEGEKTEPFLPQGHARRVETGIQESHSHRSEGNRSSYSSAMNPGTTIPEVTRELSEHIEGITRRV